MRDCGGCAERGSRHAAWTCAHCREPRAEWVDEEVWRVLLARRLGRAGVAPATTGLDFWGLSLLSLIEEDNDGIHDRYQEL